MKPAFIALLLILALLTAGCTSPAPAVPAPATTPAAPAATPASAIPALTGTWAGPTEGYREGTGFYNATGSDAVALVVSEQHGRIFAGHLGFRVNGTVQTKEIAGAIGRDGRTLTIVEKGGGYSAGTISPDGIELTYMLDSPAYSIAIDSLKKV